MHKQFFVSTAKSGQFPSSNLQGAAIHFHMEMTTSGLQVFWVLISVLTPVFLYAELHYRFPFFPFSRYYKREPEIVADMPHRVKPGTEIPLLILVKDAHLFPAFLRSVKVELRDDKGAKREIVEERDTLISQRWWHDTIMIGMDGLSGNCRTEVTFSYTVEGEERTCVNDNSPGRTEPFVCRISPSPLPGDKDGWIWGDIHSHSYLTADFVEYGAPIEAIKRAAKASELAFVAITDHSYDLDDEEDSWKDSDPDLKKWARLHDEVDRLNLTGRPLLIPGEEVSVSNRDGKNVHLLVLNHPDYIPGSGDGGERWFRTRSERSIHDVLELVQESALVVAAHPKWEPPFLQRLLLRRASWTRQDLGISGLTGMQIVNGEFNKEFERGMADWSRLLLKGKNRFIYAGNDAHGNFNLYRQVKNPMWSLWHHRSHILGKCRTGIPLSRRPTPASVLSLLRKGNSVVSNGPLATVTAKEGSSSATLGESINGNNIKVSINSISSQEFGDLRKLALIYGGLGRESEETVYGETFGPGVREAESSTTLNGNDLEGYVRAELTSVKSDGEEFACYTNPVWINRDRIEDRDE